MSNSLSSDIRGEINDVFSQDFKFSTDKELSSFQTPVEVESETCSQYYAKVTPFESGENFKLVAPFLTYQLVST